MSTIDRFLDWLGFPKPGKRAKRVDGQRCGNCAYFDDVCIDYDDPDDNISKCWKDFELTRRGDYTPWRETGEWCEHWTQGNDIGR